MLPLNDGATPGSYTFQWYCASFGTLTLLFRLLS